MTSLIITGIMKGSTFTKIRRPYYYRVNLFNTIKSNKNWKEFSTYKWMYFTIPETVLKPLW